MIVISVYDAQIKALALLNVRLQMHKIKTIQIRATHLDQSAGVDNKKGPTTPPHVTSVRLCVCLSAWRQ